MTAKLHLAEDALALHLLLERLEGLVDIVIADENLHAASFALAERLIGLDSGDEKGPKAARRFPSGARMYQIGLQLSTAGGPAAAVRT